MFVVKTTTVRSLNSVTSSRKYKRPRLEFFGSEDFDTDGEDYLSRTVYEDKSEAEFIGLLDADGNKIYWVDEPLQIGFVIHGEKEENV